MGKDITKIKDVLTTGQVAQACSVAPRTVTKWFDTGQLKGYRIPGSRDRRIPVSELIRFMKAHHMPMNSLEPGKLRVLIVDDNGQDTADLASALAERANYEVETSANVFDAGIVAQRLTPQVILINLLASNIDANLICQNIRGNADLADTKVVAFAANLGDHEKTALLQKGFDGVVSKNSDIKHLVEAIEETAAIV